MELPCSCLSEHGKSCTFKLSSSILSQCRFCHDVSTDKLISSVQEYADLQQQLAYSTANNRTLQQQLTGKEGELGSAHQQMDTLQKSLSEAETRHTRTVQVCCCFDIDYSISFIPKV